MDVKIIGKPERYRDPEQPLGTIGMRFPLNTTPGPEFLKALSEMPLEHFNQVRAAGDALVMFVSSLTANPLGRFFNAVNTAVDRANVTVRQDRAGAERREVDAERQQAKSAEVFDRQAEEWWQQQQG